MGAVQVRFLNSSRKVLLEKSVPGDASLIGVGTPRTEPGPFKGLAVNEHPMNAIAIRYAADALMALARDISGGRAADPRIGDHLAFLQVNGTPPIPLTEVLAVVPEEEVAAVIVLVAEGVQFQAQARRRQFKMLKLG